MIFIRAFFRSLILLVYLSILTPTVLLFGNVKMRRRNSTFGPLITSRVARHYLKLLGVSVTVDKPDMLENFEGFIFSNHTSYMDIVTALSVMPVRFVAKDGVKRMPFIGKIATAIGCVYVIREKKSSRKEARQALQAIDRYYPPIVIYPEGRTAPVGNLLPFRRGAFEIAHAAQVPYLLVGITYSMPHLVDWRSRSFNEAAWEIFSRKETLHVRFHVIDHHIPRPEDDPDQLRQTAEKSMLDLLVDQGNYAAEIYQPEQKSKQSEPAVSRSSD